MVYRKFGHGLILESAAFEGGRFIFRRETPEPIYFISDHLGSVRVVTNGNGTVMERNDYYPFGKRWDEGLISGYNRHRYNSKEEQGFLSLPYTDYGARMADPTIGGRWLTPDPLLEKYYPIGQYVFCAGNPVRFIDLDGRKIYFSPGVSQEFKNQFAATVKYMNEKGTSGNIGALEKSKNIYYINEAGSINDVSFSTQTNTMNWDSNHMVQTDKGTLMSPATVLAHEADHAQKYDEVVSSNDNKKIIEYNEAVTHGSDSQYGTKEEKRVITGSEQSAARKHGEINSNQTTRENHKGKQAGGVVTNMTPAQISDYIYKNNNQYINN